MEYYSTCHGNWNILKYWLVENGWLHSPNQPGSTIRIPYLATNQPGSGVTAWVHPQENGGWTKHQTWQVKKIPKMGGLIPEIKLGIEWFFASNTWFLARPTSLLGGNISRQTKRQSWSKFHLYGYNLPEMDWSNPETVGCRPPKYQGQFTAMSMGKIRHHRMELCPRSFGQNPSKNPNENVDFW